MSQATVNDEYALHEEEDAAGECEDTKSSSEYIFDNPMLENELSKQWDSMANFANSHSPQKEAFASSNTKNDNDPNEADSKLGCTVCE